MNNIITTLKSTPGATDMLTGMYKQKGWIAIIVHPTEDQLVTLAFERIQQDPNQYDLFIDMISLEWTSLWRGLHHVSCGNCIVSLLFICVLITFVYVVIVLPSYFLFISCLWLLSDYISVYACMRDQIVQVKLSQCT